MKMTINEILEKVKEGLADAGDFAVKTAGDASEGAKKVFNKSKHSVNIMELNSEIDKAYKEIGKLVYLAHRDDAENAEAIEEKIAEIDAKISEIAELRGKIDELSDTKTCTSCGAKNDKSAAFCSKCGSAL